MISHDFHTRQDFTGFPHSYPVVSSVEHFIIIWVLKLERETDCGAALRKILFLINSKALKGLLTGEPGNRKKVEKELNRSTLLFHTQYFDNTKTCNPSGRWKF